MGQRALPPFFEETAACLKQQTDTTGHVLDGILDVIFVQ
jgi:hypothetical protein